MIPDLTRYRWVVLNSSAGKDSQAMLDYVVERADAQQLPRSRLVVAHADLGRVERPGTRELAEEQARHYGLEFVTARRRQGDLPERIAQHGMFPSPAVRWCTSDHKRTPLGTLLTCLTARAWPERLRPVRILNCLGLRAQESPARSRRNPCERDLRASNGKRLVDTWLPLHSWTVEQVWERIRASDVRYHPAYDLGMPRLSCCFCIFSPHSALLLAGKHNPELLAKYVAVERRIGHRFRLGVAAGRGAAGPGRRRGTRPDPQLDHVTDSQTRERADAGVPTPTVINPGKRYPRRRKAHEGVRGGRRAGHPAALEQDPGSLDERENVGCRINPWQPEDRGARERSARYRRGERLHRTAQPVIELHSGGLGPSRHGSGPEVE